MRVSVDAKGLPSYDIAAGSAWDFIPLTSAVEHMAQRADAICFGTLAQRSPISRATIRRAVAGTREPAWRLFDVNLRQNYYDAAVVIDSLELANAVKLNEEELAPIARLCRLESATVVEQLRELSQRFGLKLAALTRGAGGSLLVSNQGVCEAPAPPTKIVDTVGAGDAFTAALLVGILVGQSLDEVNRSVDPMRSAEFATLPLAELERQRDQHRGAKERAQEERARAEELLNDRLTQIGDVASLEEEIATAREQLQDLEAEAHAYDLAIETLEAAAKSVRRAVIPRLKSQLQGQLAPITNGRYRDVRIGEDLTLTVKTQDQRAYKDVDNLSLGTRSLIYLLERVALARIIGGNAEPPPLLLDEALVHADRRRMRAALDELGRLGQDHQIILFSKDESLADRAEKAADWTIIRLPGPAVITGSAEAANADGSTRDQAEEEVAT